jgi:hypothetical protein
MFYHDLSATYLNTPDWHGNYFDILFQRVQQTPYLKEHRDWVEQNEYGMNDRPHHAMWSAIVETMPNIFTALEVGVYRGQVVSLWGLIAKHLGKTPFIFGVSPFAGTNDTVNSYSKSLNYLDNVKTIFDRFQVPFDWFTPIKGMSQQQDVIEEAENYAPYDIIYIDGGHEYESVRQDIENYATMLDKGGILVMDDASCNLNMPPFSQDKGYNRCWAGVQTVSDAVRDFLEPRTDFVHRFAVGHNRVFEKTK